MNFSPKLTFFKSYFWKGWDIFLVIIQHVGFNAACNTQHVENSSFFILNLNYWHLKLKNVGQYCHFIVSTAKDKGEKKLFGFAFTPLMREDGTTLSDESHELYVYKVRTVSTFTIKTHCVFVINANKKK